MKRSGFIAVASAAAAVPRAVGAQTLTPMRIAGVYVNGHVPEVLPIIAKFSSVDLAVLANLPFTRMGAPAAKRPCEPRER